MATAAVCVLFYTQSVTVKLLPFALALVCGIAGLCALLALVGLSVVAGHAKSWGGAATVDSTSAGTVFTVYMPSARPQMLAAQ